MSFSSSVVVSLTKLSILIIDKWTLKILNVTKYKSINLFDTFNIILFLFIYFSFFHNGVEYLNNAILVGNNGLYWVVPKEKYNL